MFTDSFTLLGVLGGAQGLLLAALLLTRRENAAAWSSLHDRDLSLVAAIPDPSGGLATSITAGTIEIALRLELRRPDGGDVLAKVRLC